MDNTLKIIKIGGNVINHPQELSTFLTAFAAVRSPKILVHGGGAMATALSHQLGIPAEMVDGRRITTQEDLWLVTMVYAGWINKNIVAQLQYYQCNAIGLSGCDGDIIQAIRRPAQPLDYGYVGNITAVASQRLADLLALGYTPVLSAIGHDGAGQLLNTNADTIAAEVAAAMTSHFDTELWYCFEKAGVLADVQDDNSVLPQLSAAEVAQLKVVGAIHHGMLPKLDNGFLALRRMVARVRIGDIRLLLDADAGTEIVE